MTTQPRRRWFPRSFGMRTLFVILTIFGVWLGIQVTRAREQRAAVAEIRSAANGVEIAYDYEFDESGAFIPGAQPPGPEWLRQWVGIDYFANVQVIALPRLIFTSCGRTRLVPLDNDDFTDRTLIAIKNLPNLRKLDLGGTAVTDAGVDSLTGLTRLVEMDVTGAGISELEIRKLEAALPHLAIKTQYTYFTRTVNPTTGQTTLTLP